jgi:hypothetical protein
MMDEKYHKELEWRILEVEHALMQWRLAVKAKVLPRKDPATFGTPIQPFGPPPIRDVSSPGFGWKLSEAARKNIEAIEENSRMALHRIGHLIVN